MFEPYATMQFATSFFSNHYGKLTISALVCILLCKNYQLQGRLHKAKKRKNILLTKLATAVEKFKRTSGKEKQEYLCDVIFFDGRAGNCADHVVEKLDCPLQSCPAYKIRKIISYINAATTSLDLCIYVFRNKTLGNAILRAQKRGVKVRVISDEDKVFAHGSEVNRFVKTNIPIFFTGSPFIMHEKYLILDSAIVLHGSLNWTTFAMSGNYESVVITDMPSTVRQFQKHFDAFYERLRNDRLQRKKESKLTSAQIRKGESWDND